MFAPDLPVMLELDSRTEMYPITYTGHTVTYRYRYTLPQLDETHAKINVFKELHVIFGDVYIILNEGSTFKIFRCKLW